MSADLLARFRRTSSGPRVFGHRGASARRPENTLAAFALALDEGADGIELDTRRCASGEMVVMHDPTLLRTAGDPRFVREVPRRELSALDVGGGEPVPLLDEALDVVLGRGGLVNVELKGDDDDRWLLARTLARTLARRSAAERDAIVISTFDPRVLFALQWERAAVPVVFLFENTRQGRVRGRVVPRLLSPAGINPEHVLVNAARVKSWHARGLLVTTWTVDGEERVLALSDAGVDGLITNDPAGTVAALRSARR